MIDIAERKVEYFNFLWNSSLEVVETRLLARYPELGAYVQPNGAATTLLVAAHFAVLRQRDEMFGEDGAFDEYEEDAERLDDYIESCVNGWAGESGLPVGMYQKLMQNYTGSVHPDAMWLLADMGGGGKMGRIVAVHSQVGNYISRSFFSRRGASAQEIGEFGNVLNLLFASCYLKYAETLGFDRTEYGVALQVRKSSREAKPRQRPRIESLECPENPFISSLVEHVASAELSGYGHEAPSPGPISGWAKDFFNDYFYGIDVGVRNVEESDVRVFADQLEEFVRVYAPEVVKRYLDRREDFVWSFGLKKGAMVMAILREIWGEDKSVEERILARTNDFIEGFLDPCCCDGELEDMID